jgi:hypothetical protein
MVLNTASMEHPRHNLAHDTMADVRWVASSFATKHRSASGERAMLRAKSSLLAPECGLYTGLLLKQITGV